MRQEVYAPLGISRWIAYNPVLAAEIRLGLFTKRCDSEDLGQLITVIRLWRFQAEIVNGTYCNVQDILS
jgi:hypothetical protein